jgi:hypothetical protein
MNVSKMRKRVDDLDRERGKIQGFLLRPEEMVYGSFYELYRKCGNANCRCTRGEKHIANCLSIQEGGKTKLTYVRKQDEGWVRMQAENYRIHHKRMAMIRKINDEIFEILKQIRDSKLKRYE